MEATDKEKLELKGKIIAEEMTKFWDFVKTVQIQYQEREEWQRDANPDCYSNEAPRVIPESVEQFTKTFLTSLTEILSEI